MWILVTESYTSLCKAIYGTAQIDGDEMTSAVLLRWNNKGHDEVNRYLACPAKS